MKTLLPILFAFSTACQRPNVLITVLADPDALEDGLKQSERFDLSLFLYSAADGGLAAESKTVGLDNEASFRLNPGTLDLHAISLDSDPPESCDPTCDGYWEGETANLVVPTKGHIQESVTVFAVCDC